MIILVADADSIRGRELADTIAGFGHAATVMESGDDALTVLAGGGVDIAVMNRRLGCEDGLAVERALTDYANLPIIVLATDGALEDAVRFMRMGAADYLTIPVDTKALEASLLRPRTKRKQSRESSASKTAHASSRGPAGMVYVSEAMEEVMNRVERAAASNATVLLSGESGTGKELVARAIHEAGDRADNAYVAVNCSAVPENLIESEFFGHEKGSFTGAERRRIGRFEQADGGTLFLDEVAEIPLQVQAKLLRVIQEREFERVGGNDTIKTDVRIVAAANRNLEQCVEQGEFREDLYYRLNVVHITLPPLRERKADIPVLADFFLEQYAREHDQPRATLDGLSIDRLVKYSFPGNIRELSNIIEQAVVLSQDGVIRADDLPIKNAEMEEGSVGTQSLDERVAELERNAIKRAMKESGGNKSAAARLLGITERRIRYMIKKYGEAMLQ